ncbi:hypothetical protein HD806DRAFT_541183 [Xylariaceae sp. AK1471]|nr:hypothetical protein HD806DRAFT_541183 [Xylariaceae sp. AK1471]
MGRKKGAKSIGARLLAEHRLEQNLRVTKKAAEIMSQRDSVPWSVDIVPCDHIDYPIVELFYFYTRKRSILVIRLSKAQYDRSSLLVLVRDLCQLYAQHR